MFQEIEKNYAKILITYNQMTIGILLLSIPTMLICVFRSQFTFLHISLIGGSWLYKLLYKFMKHGYEKEQIWSEKSSWKMKLYRHINYDIQKSPKKNFLDKTASREGLSYEGSSKKRKNTYLWTRCGSGCCTLEHIYELFLGVVSIWEMMWEMNFIRSGDNSRLRFAILNVLTLTNL